MAARPGSWSSRSTRWPTSRARSWEPTRPASPRRSWLASPLLYDLGEANNGNWGDFTITFDPDGKVTFTQTNTIEFVVDERHLLGHPGSRRPRLQRRREPGRNVRRLGGASSATRSRSSGPTRSCRRRTSSRAGRACPDPGFSSRHVPPGVHPPGGFFVWSAGRSPRVRLAIPYDVPALEAGEYFFRCDVHRDMKGTIVAGG